MVTLPIKTTRQQGGSYFDDQDHTVRSTFYSLWYRFLARLAHFFGLFLIKFRFYSEIGLGNFLLKPSVQSVVNLIPHFTIVQL